MEMFAAQMFETFLMMGWAIWVARNEVIWNGKFASPHEVTYGASTRLLEFLKMLMLIKAKVGTNEIVHINGLNPMAMA